MLSPQEINQLARALVKPLAAEIMAMQRRQESIRHGADFDTTDLQELKRKNHLLMLEQTRSRRKKHA